MSESLRARSLKRICSPGIAAALVLLRSAWLKHHWDIVLFAAACVLLVYLGGMATAHYRLLPYTTIRDLVRRRQRWPRQLALLSRHRTD